MIRWSSDDGHPKTAAILQLLRAKLHPVRALDPLPQHPLVHG